MTNGFAISCRLCLEPDELDSMVTMSRQFGAPERTLTVIICRACAREISRSIMALDAEDGIKPAGAVEVQGAWDAGVQQAVANHEYKDAIEAAAAAREESKPVVEFKHGRHTGRRTARDISDDVD